MKKYKIDILPSAIDDLISLKKNLVSRYEDDYNATKVVQGIFNTIDSLDVFPKRAQAKIIISNLKIRFIKSGKYSIAYYVDDDSNTVKIHGIFHSHIDITRIIKNPKK